MKKEVKRIEIGWRLYSLIMGFIFLVGFLGFSFAYGGSSPSAAGHSAGEIEVTYNGTTTNLNSVMNTINSQIASSKTGGIQGVSVSDCSWYDANVPLAGQSNILTTCPTAKPIMAGFNARFNNNAYLGFGINQVYCCKLSSN
jgi:hypothetical protein